MNCFFYRKFASAIIFQRKSMYNFLDMFINFLSGKKWLVRIPKKGLQDFEFVNRQVFVGDKEDSLDSPEEIILQQEKKKK